MLPPLTRTIYGTYLLWKSSEWSTQVRCTKSRMFALVLMEELIVPSKLKLCLRERLINMNEPPPKTGVSVEDAGPEDDLTGLLEIDIANQKSCFLIPPGWQANTSLRVKTVQAYLLLLSTPIKQLKKRFLIVETI